MEGPGSSIEVASLGCFFLCVLSALLVEMATDESYFLVHIKKIIMYSHHGYMRFSQTQIFPQNAMLCSFNNVTSPPLGVL